MHIVIVPNDKGTPVGKVADAEVHFTEGLLAGAKLVGFGIWESRWPGGGIRVTVPSREYTKDGETKRYDLLRPIDREHDQPAIDALRDAILEAYQEQDGGIEQATAIAREVGRAAAQMPRRAQAQAPPPARPAPRPVAPRAAPPAPASRPPVRQAVPMRRAAAVRQDLADLDDIPF